MGIAFATPLDTSSLADLATITVAMPVADSAVMVDVSTVPYATDSAAVTELPQVAVNFAVAHASTLTDSAQPTVLMADSGAVSEQAAFAPALAASEPVAYSDSLVLALTGV